MNKLLLLLFCLINFQINAQIFLGNDGSISFFSKTPIEDITAINNNVSAVFDSKTNDLLFQLKISDFIFPIALMQEHFNENYLESDIYPKSTFIGKIIKTKNDSVNVLGDLTIHGETKSINVDGIIIRNNKSVKVYATFSVNLEDYKIKVPKIVMYKIAEKIDIKVNIELIKS